MEPHWEGVTKFCINGPGHMTKMAAMPIYGKNLLDLLLRTSGPISTKLGMYHLGLQPIIIFTNDDPWVDLDLFYAKVKFGYTDFSIEKSENS